MKTDCSISELKDGIKRLPKKEEVKKEKPKEKDKKGYKLVETVIDTVSIKKDTLSKDSTKKENILKFMKKKNVFEFTPEARS